MTHPPAPAQASTSTATLVPRSPHATSSGERTPRPSIDDTATGIGNLMLNDPGDVSIDSIAPTSPTRSTAGHPQDSSLASPFSSRPHAARTSSLQNMQDPPFQPRAESPIQPPPRRTSMAATQALSPPLLASPVTASSRTSGTTDLVSPNDVRSSDSHHRRNRSRTSKGLESELDDSIEEGDESMEVLSQQHTAVPYGDDAHPLASAQSSDRRGSEPHRISIDRPLPPLPNSAPMANAYGHQRQASASSTGGRPTSGSFLVSPTVNQSTIVQRRLSRGVEGVPSGNALQSSQIDGLPGTGGSQRDSTGLFSSFGQRSRTRSQPHEARLSVDQVPPLPNSTVKHKSSFGSRLSARISSSASSSIHGNNSGLRIDTSTTANLAPPLPTSSQSSFRSGTSTLPRSQSGSLISPVPEAQPSEIILRSFHILRMICLSMDPESSGAYLTSHIHISPAVWQPGSFIKPGQKASLMPRIVAAELKTRVLETMCFHLDIIRTAGARLLVGSRDYVTGMGHIDGVDRHGMVAVGDDLCAILDAMDEDMVNTYKALGKVGVPIQPWKEKSKKPSVSRLELL